MTPRTSGRVVGVLLLLAFGCYGAGSGLVDAAAGAPVMLSEVTAHETQLAVGALLMLLNSVVVAGIGVVAFPVVRPHGQISAHAYLVARAFEAVMLAVGIVLLLLLVPLGREDEPSIARVAQDGSQYSYWIAMIGLALGSLLFCRVLFRARLVPRFLAAWGLVGYAALAAGAVLEVLGHGLGLAFSVPGGLFEVALAVLLLVRGFPGKAVGGGR